MWLLPVVSLGLWLTYEALRLLLERTGRKDEYKGGAGLRLLVILRRSFSGGLRIRLSRNMVRKRREMSLWKVVLLPLRILPMDPVLIGP